MPRGKARANTTTTRSESDRSLLTGVRGLVERNALLEAENRRLRQLLDEISRSLKAPVATGADAPKRRGRPPRVMVDAASETPRRRGRPRKNPVPQKVRRKITDPVVLEKRRAALTKARAVRAERLAAARG
jgi:hypothetical protein